MGGRRAQGSSQWLGRGQADGAGPAVADELRALGRRPYLIPEGGSNALGSLGYVLAMAELEAQLPPAWRAGPVVVVYAAGSGGTGAGIELVRAFVGAHFSGEERHLRRLAKVEALEER